jgi:hypothetical protein
MFGKQGYNICTYIHTTLSKRKDGIAHCTTLELIMEIKNVLCQTRLLLPEEVGTNPVPETICLFEVYLRE